MPPDLPSVGLEVDVAWWARRRDKVGVVEYPWMVPRAVFLKFLKTRVTRRTTLHVAAEFAGNRCRIMVGSFVLTEPLT